MKKLFILPLIFTIQLLFAQNNEMNETLETPVREKAIFKRGFTIPFTSFFDFTSPSINIGFEQTINKRFGIQTTVGYSNNYLNPLYNAIALRSFNGAKIALDLRYYFARKQKTNLFITPGLFYKVIIENHNNEFVWRYGGLYQEMLDFKRVIQMVSLTPKFGFNVLKPNKPIGFEFSVGLGVRFQHVSFSSLPDDVEYNTGSGFFITDVNNINKGSGLYIRPNAFLSMALLIVGKM